MPSNVSPSDLKTLLSQGFSLIDPTAASKAPPRLAVATRGKTKCGKTHWALMTTPQPVAFVMLDPGSVPLAQKAVSRGRIIIPKHIPHSLKESQAIAVNLWKDYRNTLKTIARTPSIRTLVIDTISECWDLLQMAEFGKIKQNNKFAYGPLNAEFAGLIDELYDVRRDLNIVLIQKVKKEYSAKGEGKEDAWDGKSYYAKGYGELDYLVDCSITHAFVPKTSDTPAHFFIETLSSEATRLGPEFSGLRFRGPECDFTELAMHIFGPSGLNHPLGADPKYWGLL